MALLTSHSAANRVVDSALVVTYSVSWQGGSWQQTSSMGITVASYDHMFEFRRRARKSYRYVGMTEAAANACKGAMIEKYTRSFSVSVWDDFNGIWADQPGGTVPMADVAMSHNDDGSYDVVVNVNEDDVRMSIRSSSSAVAAMFYEERLRDYDGETEEPQSGND